MGIALFVVSVATSLFTALTALAAFLAVRNSQKQTSEVQRFWEAERRSEVYRVVVRKPAMRLRDDFLAMASQIVRDGIDDVVGTGENGDGDLADRRIGKLCREFNSSYHACRRRYAEFRSIDAVDLGSLVDDLQRCVSRFQDQVTMLFDQSDVQALLVEFEALALTHRGEIANLLARHDPALVHQRLTRNAGCNGR